MRFGELDLYAHVNHTVYLQYFEHGRVVALDATGQGLTRLLDEDIAMVVAQVTTRFIAPGFLGDELIVESGVSEAGRASATWLQRIVRAEEVLVTQVVRAGCTDGAGHVRRFPPDLVEALAPFRVDADWLGSQGPR